MIIVRWLIVIVAILAAMCLLGLAIRRRETQSGTRAERGNRRGERDLGDFMS